MLHTIHVTPVCNIWNIKSRIPLTSIPVSESSSGMEIPIAKINCPPNYHAMLQVTTWLWPSKIYSYIQLLRTITNYHVRPLKSVTLLQKWPPPVSLGSNKTFFSVMITHPEVGGLWLDVHARLHFELWLHKTKVTGSDWETTLVLTKTCSPLKISV